VSDSERRDSRVAGASIPLRTATIGAAAVVLGGALDGKRAALRATEWAAEAARDAGWRDMGRVGVEPTTKRLRVSCSTN
jgi:hypothetical protein